MNNNMLYKDTIREFDNRLNQIKREEVIYRLISIKNIFFFAEEISTGCIFPVYYFASTENLSYKGGNVFNSHSNERVGKYYLYGNISKSEKIFHFNINAEDMDKPSIEEVNKYLKEKKNNKAWKNKIMEYESDNHYNCDINILKQIITMAKEDMEIEEEQLDDLPLKSEFYTPSIETDEISEFGYDLSSKEKTENLIGREEEVKQLIKTISIKGKSILIIGPPGSGKTSLVKDLASKIKTGKNKWLQGKMIFNVNIASSVSDSKYRGEFEKKFQNLIDFCVENKNKIILFIDEIHTLYGLGRTENSSIDAMNILKPYLCDRELTVIGATTNEEYQKYMANDPAFLERFEILDLTAINEELNIKILMSYINELEEKYKIKLNLSDKQRQDISKYIINITDKKNQKVVGDSIKISNPRLSKTIIEEAFAEALYTEKNEVTVEDISFAIISCSKLSPTFRKERAEELKTRLNITKNKNKVLQLTPVK